MEQGSPAYKPLVWFDGDSFVYWTSRVAATIGAGMDLNLIATVHWMGKRGLHITEFNDFLHSCWKSERTSPDYIISMLTGTICVLTVTGALLPQTIMFGSAILPRVNRALFDRTRSSGSARPLTVGSVTHALCIRRVYTTSPDQLGR